MGRGKRLVRRRRQAMPHQGEFLRWAGDRDAVAAYMEMRLGKSLCAVRWVESKPDVRKALIVCPPAVVPSWRRELAQEGQVACEVTGATQDERERAVAAAGPDHKWYVVNVEGLRAREAGRTVPSAWARLAWDAVVIDEATCVRNPKSRTTRIALDHLADARYRALLTGLPNPEGPEDYVTQMLFLEGAGGRFMGARNFWEWRAEHMQPARFGWTIKGASLGVLRQEVRARSFFLTRKQAGMPDEKLRQVRHVQLPKAVKAAIARARTDLEVADRLTNNALVAMQWECQLAGGRFPGLEHDAKFAELTYLATGEFSREKLVVWARHTAELVAAASALEAAGASVECVRGSVPREERQRIVDRFMTERHPRVLVAQPKCLHVGVDLSVAEVSIVLSNYFDYEVRAQFEDRIVHPMKARPALVLDLVAEGTIDEDIVQALTEKRVNSRSFNARLLEIARQRRAA